MSFHRRPLFRRRGTEAALTRIHRERRTPYEITERIDVDRRLCEANAVTDVPEAPLQPQLVTRLHVDVGPPVELFVPVPRDDADVIVVRAGEIVAIGIGAAVQARDVSLSPSALEDRLVAVLDVIFIKIETNDLTRHAAAGRAEDLTCRA